MSSLSVQGRITLIAGCCLLASAVALVASSFQRGPHAGAGAHLHHPGGAARGRKLDAGHGATQAARVTSYLDEAYFRATLLAEGILFQRKNAADNFVHSEALRNAVNQQLQDAAESSANLLGVYAVFEPNQLDGEDDNYQGSTALGANDKGRFLQLLGQGRWQGDPGGDGRGDAGQRQTLRTRRPWRTTGTVAASAARRSVCSNPMWTRWGPSRC